MTILVIPIQWLFSMAKVTKINSWQLILYILKQESFFTIINIIHLNVLELIARYVGNKLESSESCNLRFEDLRISYTNLINKAQRRKSDLKDQYYFNCTCDRCNIDKSELSCVITKTTLQLNELAKEGSLLCRNCKSCIPVGTQQGKYIYISFTKYISIYNNNWM